MSASLLLGAKTWTGEGALLMSMDVGKLLAIEDVSERLNVSISTVRRLIRDGVLPAYRVGGRLRFRAREVEAYIDAQRIYGADRELADDVHTEG